MAARLSVVSGLGGSAELAQKAAGRRERISIFGGLKSKTVGRRNISGKIFNRRNAKKKPASDAGVTTPTQTTTPGLENFGSDDDDE